MVSTRSPLLLLSTLAALIACGDPAEAPPPDGGAGVPDAPAAPVDAAPPDADLETIPRFTTAFTVDLAAVERISRFRSGVGHDFSDSRESCRSMKHYLCPRPCAHPHAPSWTTIAVHAPVSGTLVRVEPEQTYGTQLHLAPAGHEGWVVRVFHVTPVAGLAAGDAVAAGQLLGTHASDDTMSDVAVEQRRPDGSLRRVSIFDTMPDEVFAALAARGVASRAALAITAAERDADPLVCDGERFVTSGTLEGWVTLTP